MLLTRAVAMVLATESYTNRKITDMVKTAMACFRDMLFEIEVFFKRYSEL